jgi:hypothetical protein
MLRVLDNYVQVTTILLVLLQPNHTMMLPRGVSHMILSARFWRVGELETDEQHSRLTTPEEAVLCVL